MEEYSLDIPTNAWNAIRYALITLALVPLAEKLWALAHSRRTAARLLQGRPARLRKSKLAHFGLHQEVDESSRLSKISSIVVCALHITGALLLEYGSASIEGYVFKGAVLSATPSFSGEMLADDAYFVDTSYVTGNPDGSPECIDGEPRNLSDFGLYFRQEPSRKHTLNLTFPATYNNQSLFQSQYSFGTWSVIDNGSARWYQFHSQLYFATETTFCQFRYNPYLPATCYNVEKAHSYLHSALLTYLLVPGSEETPGYLKVSVLLNRVAIISKLWPYAVLAAETAWVRNSMPRKEMMKNNDPFDPIDVRLSIKPLKDSCTHNHSVYVSHRQQLRNLRVINETFPLLQEYRVDNLEDHKLLVMVSGNSTRVGTIKRVSKGYCSVFQDTWLCVRRLKKSKHELFYGSHLPFADEIFLQFRISIEGDLDREDTVNLAVQALIDAMRENDHEEVRSMGEVKTSIVEQIDRGKIYRKFVRVAGRTMKGKTVHRRANSATINNLGLVAISMILLLAALPIPTLLYYREMPAGNLESMYRRLAMRRNKVQVNQEGLRTTPTIVVEPDTKLSEKRPFREKNPS